MNETPLFAQNRIIFFLSRIFILAGMVLVFASISSLLGYGLGKLLGVDLLTMNEILENPEQNSHGMFVLKLFQIIASIGTFIIPAWLFPKAIGKNALVFLKIKKPTAVYPFVIGFVCILLATPVVSYIYGLNQQIQFPPQWAEFEKYLKDLEQNAAKITEAFTNTSSIGVLLFNLIVVAIIPAVAEELFFRGCLQNFVRMVFYNAHIAILFTAIIFSGFHGQFYGFLPRILLGIVLGYLYLYSNNIWVPILAHFINNGMALIGAYLFKLNPSYEVFANDYQFPIIVVVLTAAICTSLLYYLNQLQYKKLEINE